MKLCLMNCRETWTKLGTLPPYRRKATQSLGEIGELQSILSHHIASQSEVISSIHNDAVEATLNVESGNKWLKSAEVI
jgi:t-SNARE complex subunit (syntaxin)